MEILARQLSRAKLAPIHVGRCRCKEGHRLTEKKQCTGLLHFCSLCRELSVKNCQLGSTAMILYVAAVICMIPVSGHNSYGF
jgi:hypothetical protein